MRFEQLEYVRAVTEHGSLRRAGEHLHVSQPALSEAIGKLERELGVTLLDRHHSGTRINDQGRELLPRIGEVLDAVDRLRAAARGEADFHRPTRVGAVYFGVTAVVVPALRQHDRDHRHSPVELRQARRAEIEAGLRDGSLDVGLINLLPGDDLHPDLVTSELLQGRPVAVLPADHRLVPGAEVDTEDLRQEAFVGPREGVLMHRVAHRVFGDDPPLKWHTADGADLCKQLVASGLGVGLMPDFALADDPLVETGRLVVRALRDEVPVIRMVLVQRRGARPSAATANLVAHLTRHGEALMRRA